MQKNHSTPLVTFLFLFLSLIALTINSYAVGILDQTFGNGGIVTTDLGSEASVKSIHQQSDGKIIIVAKTREAILLLRYNVDGSLDTSFGTNGKIITTYSGNDDKVSFNIQSNGLLAVGNNSSVTRYTSTGTISQTVSFPTGDFAAFGADGQIATASLLPGKWSVCFRRNPTTV